MLIQPNQCPWLTLFDLACRLRCSIRFWNAALFQWPWVIFFLKSSKIELYDIFSAWCISYPHGKKKKKDNTLSNPQDAKTMTNTNSAKYFGDQPRCRVLSWHTWTSKSSSLGSLKNTDPTLTLTAFECSCK